MNPLLRTSSAHVFVDDLAVPTLSDEDNHHLTTVMRVRSNEHVSVSDGAGRWRVCSLNTRTLTPTTEIVAESAPERETAVALVPVKGDRTEWAVEKLVEIGVSKIIILEPTEYAVVRWTSEKMATNIERMQRIARAAAMQSRRVWLPKVVGPVAFADLVEADGVAVADPEGQPLSDVDHTIVIGPEGGFSPSEIGRARTVVALGATILRADTAAMVAGLAMVTRDARTTDHTGSQP